MTAPRIYLARVRVEELADDGTTRRPWEASVQAWPGHRTDLRETGTGCAKSPETAARRAFDQALGQLRARDRAPKRKAGA